MLPLTLPKCNVISVALKVVPSRDARFRKASKVIQARAVLRCWQRRAVAPMRKTALRKLDTLRPIIEREESARTDTVLNRPGKQG